MDDIYIKTRGNNSPLFFPANRLITLNKDESIINTHSDKSSVILYQGENALEVYEDILSTREVFWKTFMDTNNNDIETQLKAMLSSFPYLTTGNMSNAWNCNMRKADIYLPLLPNASSRIQVEYGEDLAEVIIDESMGRFTYICHRDTLRGLPCKETNVYKDLMDNVEFLYMVDGFIKGLSPDERVFYYPPINDWYKYTPEVGGLWEGKSSGIIHMTPKSKSINISEIEKIRVALDQKIKENFLRKVQALI